MLAINRSLTEITMIKYNIRSDLDFIFSKCKNEFNLLSNKSVLVTGGTGFFWEMVFRFKFFMLTKITIQIF